MLPSAPKPRRIKKPAELKVKCWICGAGAADHLHYGAICCYSCRAFFRRSGHRNYVCVDRKHKCTITPNNRKQCKLCRYTRCVAVGMKPEMVDATLARRKDENQEEIPDSTTHLSDEEVQEDSKIKMLDLDNRQIDCFSDSFTKSETESLVYENNNQKPFINYKDSIDQVNMYSKDNNYPHIRFPAPNHLNYTNDTKYLRRISYEEEVQKSRKEIIVNESEQKYQITHPPNQVSVIKKAPANYNQEAFPASFTNMLVPFKKRESAKEWIPYCQKLSLSLKGSPSLTLTTEESLFIDQRVAETKALVQILHENCVKYLDEKEAYKTVLGLDLEKEHCVEIFRNKAGEIFSNPLSNNENQSVEEIYNTNLIKSRFLCCGMAAVAVRLFGGPDVDCAPHDHLFYQKYTFLLKSPWASSLEQEREVVNTLRLLGALIGSDKRIEVLFSSAIMRGFRDVSPPARMSPDGDMGGVQKPLAQRLPNLLTGTQFSLLLFRYLKDTRPQAEAISIFQQLESLIQPLYGATNTFYCERLKF